MPSLGIINGISQVLLVTWQVLGSCSMLQLEAVLQGVLLRLADGELMIEACHAQQYTTLFYAIVKLPCNYQQMWSVVLIVVVLNTACISIVMLHMLPQCKQRQCSNHVCHCCVYVPNNTTISVNVFLQNQPNCVRM